MKLSKPRNQVVPRIQFRPFRFGKLFFGKIQIWSDVSQGMTHFVQRSKYEKNAHTKVLIVTVVKVNLTQSTSFCFALINLPCKFSQRLFVFKLRKLQETHWNHGKIISRVVIVYPTPPHPRKGQWKCWKKRLNKSRIVTKNPCC